MKNLSSSEVRQMFLDFFKSKGHDVEPSASLIPVDDPTLLWINSGVATIKKYFDGTVVPKNPRITSAQKSIRTNDIENVGKTARHLTFFEMLGNFSVGDYFKKEAITWAWELLTDPKWFALPAEKLFITVYPKDKLAYELWQEVGVPKDHIYKVDDNFWDIGGGPSGPDTEIFYDRGQALNNIEEDDPENYPGGENERYLEIWNIVFSEFNHLPDGRYVEQPHKNIDTGMGLERVVSVFQHAKTNYETDLFMPLIEQVEKLTDKKYGEDDKVDSSFKIIADHIRTLTFAISDGAEPSNEGRGYVLRRLLRRAVLNGQKLGINHPFLADLVPEVSDIMHSYYPEIATNVPRIKSIIEKEELKFNRTLNDGLKLLNSVIESPDVKKSKQISGKDAFKLFDTYGFPVELTQEAAAESGITVDLDGYHREMEQQRSRARSARSKDLSMGSQNLDLLNFKDESKFVGYNTLKTDAKLLFLMQDEIKVSDVSEGSAIAIFDKTPFYAEMGGQVGDTGSIYDQEHNLVARVIDTKHAPNGQNMHFIDVLKPLGIGNSYYLEVDQMRHENIERNHTATHLVDEALRDVLGKESHQAGSLVAPEYLRFDFTSDDKISSEQLARVEEIVNEKIFADIPVVTKEESYKKAIDDGAVALFSEKYGDNVRVVNVADYSIQLCGGTHVKRTSEIGLFKITESTGVGAGVRRIVALTGPAVYKYIVDEEKTTDLLLKEIGSKKLTDAVEKVANLKEELSSTQDQLNNLKNQIASKQANELFANKKEVNGWSYLAGIIDGMDAKELRQIADQWRNQKVSDILVLGSSKDDKDSLLVAVVKDKITDKISAKNLINKLAPLFGGRGGGNNILAVAGGKKANQLANSINSVENTIKELI